MYNRLQFVPDPAALSITAIVPVGPAPVYSTMQAAMFLALVRYYCPACGYPGLALPAYARLGPPPWLHPGPPPYGRWYGEPTYEVCSCCGFEPGNDDDSWSGTVRPLSFEQYLREWVRSGGNWLDESLKPEGWDLAEQLRAAGITLDPNA